MLGKDIYSYKCDNGISEVWRVQAALGAPLAPGVSQLVLQQGIVADTSWGGAA